MLAKAGLTFAVYNGTMASLIALVSFLTAVQWTWGAFFNYLIIACREIILWAVVIVLSFVFSLLGIDRKFAPNLSDYQIAMQRQGLTRSTSIIGSVSSVRRGPDGQLALTGWAFDRELGQSVSVFAFVNGVFEPIAITKGSRHDVSEMLHLSAEQGTNVVFSGRIERLVNCESGSVFKVVAINQRKHLTIIDRVQKPGCGRL